MPGATARAFVGLGAHQSKPLTRVPILILTAAQHAGRAGVLGKLALGEPGAPTSPRDTPTAHVLSWWTKDSESPSPRLHPWEAGLGRTHGVPADFQSCLNLGQLPRGGHGGRVGQEKGYPTGPTSLCVWPAPRLSSQRLRKWVWSRDPRSLRRPWDSYYLGKPSQGHQRPALLSNLQGRRPLPPAHGDSSSVGTSRCPLPLGSTLSCGAGPLTPGSSSGGQG